MSRTEQATAGGRHDSVASVAALLFDGLSEAGLRYVPAYLVALGAPPLVVGLFGSYWLLLSVPASSSYLLARLGIDRRSRLDALATLGVGGWVLAPVAGGGTFTSALPFLVGGFGLVALRNAAVSGSKAHLSTVGTLVRAGTVRGLFALGGGLLLVALLVDGARGVVPALSTAFALTAALGVIAVVLQTVGDGSGDGDGSGGTSWRLRAEWDIDWSGFAAELVRASPSRRSLLVADLSGRFVLGMTAPFVVLTVVYGRAFDAVVFGTQLGSLSAFAGLAMLDVLGAALSVPLAVFVGRRAGPGAVGLAAIALSAAVPLALALGPTRPAVFGALFVGYGLRHSGWATIDTIVAETFTAANGRTYRLARGLVAAPSALLGGALYGYGPEVAFGAAAAVGMIASWEWLRFALGTWRDG